MKKFKILSLYPEIYSCYKDFGIMKRAIEKEAINIEVFYLRDFSPYKHKIVDDYPYGGGSGMILKIDVIFNALKSLKDENQIIILTAPDGEVFNQRLAEKLSQTYDSFLFINGYFEGIDARIEHFIDKKISIGDFILSNGDLATMVIIDSIVRLIPNVLGNENSIKEESFKNFLLEYPQYTRPYDFMGYKVPEILLSGHHEKIKRWRLAQSIKKTKKYRKDLYEKYKKTERKK